MRVYNFTWNAYILYMLIILLPIAYFTKEIIVLTFLTFRREIALFNNWNMKHDILKFRALLNRYVKKKKKETRRIFTKTPLDTCTYMLVKGWKIKKTRASYFLLSNCEIRWNENPLNKICSVRIKKKKK